MAQPGRVIKDRRIRAFPPLVGLLPLVVLLALWQLLGSPDSPSFPVPSEWFTALTSLDAGEVVLPAVARTILVFAGALLVATVLGVVLGTVMGASRKAERALSPLTEFCRTFPPPAAVPVAVLILGNTLGMSILVIVATAMWPIVINTVAGVQAIPSVRIDAARILGLSLRERIGKVVVPSVLPGIALGVRVAAPICLIVTLLAEMLASTGGLGQLILGRQRVFDAAGVFGLLVLIGVLGLVVNALVGWIEGRALANHPRRG
jgi:ABC-type nitrate/sulfonate/bicarbonate transport system permease component